MNIDHDRNDLDPKMAERFSKLRAIPPRDPTQTALGRAAFLSQARELAQKNPRPVPVSPAPLERLILWTQKNAEVFKRKELQPMFTKIMAVLIAATLVFGGAAATAYASQASLPNDALYGVKTFGENLRLSLAPETNAKLGIALEIAQRRVQEMAALSEMDIEIPAHFASQYQEQVEYTLRLAASLPDEEIVPALEQIRSQLQEQLRTMEQLQQVQPEDPALVQAREQLRAMEQLHQANPEEPALVQAREQVRAMEQLQQAQAEDPALVQAREQLRQQLRLVEDGLVDPLQFRAQIRHREQFGFGPAPVEPPGPMVTPPVPGPGPQNGNENANGNEAPNGNSNQIRSGNSSGNADNNGNGNNGNANSDDDNGGKDDDGGGDRDDDNGGGDDDGDDGGGDHDNGGGGGNGGGDH